jgi:hypothetical protein
VPSKYTIPSRTETHCAPCEFHKCTGALCGPAGGNSWRRYSCFHPDAFGDLKRPEDETLRDKFNAMVARMLHHGRDIGKTEEQPNWCPLRRTSDE